MGGARQLYSDSTNGTWTWGLKAQNGTSGEACLALQPLPGMGSPLALVGSQKPQGLVVGPGWASRLSIQAPQETHIDSVSPYIFLKMTLPKI